MGKLNKLSEAVHADMVRAYESGSSLKDLGKLYECTAPTVATFLKSVGVKIRGKGKRKKATVIESADGVVYTSNEVVEDTELSFTDQPDADGYPELEV